MWLKLSIHLQEAEFKGVSAQFKMSREARKNREIEQEFFINFTIFCVFNIKSKEISWRVRGEEKEEKSKF